MKPKFMQLKLRLRPALHASMRHAAKLSGRSLNAEIVSRLDQSLREDRVISLLLQIRDDAECQRS